MTENRLRLEQQLRLCREVARLIRARLPLAGELSRLAGKKSASWAATARRVDDQIAQGKSLASAIAGDASRDSRMLAACIECGEYCGCLERTIECWAGMHLANSRANRALRSAMLYPLMLIVVTIGSLGFVCWKLIPEYRTTYALFSQELPGWLDLLVRIRDQIGPLLAGMVIVIFLPLVVWFLRRRTIDRDGLPRDAARRIRQQAMISELAGIGISQHMPLTQLVPLCMIAGGGQRAAADGAFGLLQKQVVVPQLGRETMLLLSSLHAGIISPEEASKNLLEIAQHLRITAEQVAHRHARWLPMLVALIVGCVTLLTYVFLIYLPWVLLLQRVVTPAVLGL